MKHSMPGSRACALLPRAGLARWPAGQTVCFALLGYAASDLPGRLHGLPTHWIWNGLGALACAAAGRFERSCSTGLALACAFAVAVGLTFDFAFRLPEAFLLLCGSGIPAYSLREAALAHLQVFPATALAMGPVAATHALRMMSRKAQTRSARVVSAIGRFIIEYAAMLASMSLCMAVFEQPALAQGWPWLPNAMTSAMLTGMAVFLLLRERLFEPDVQHLGALPHHAQRTPAFPPITRWCSPPKFDR